MKANRILSHSHLGAGIFIPVLIRFPLVTLKATNSNYWAGKRLPLITFYYLNGFLCPSITLITLNGKSLPIKEMAPYNRHDPKNLQFSGQFGRKVWGLNKF